MSVDMFLKIDDLPGESQHKGFEGWIEVDSFQWGLVQPLTDAPTRMTAGKAAVSDISFASRMSKASPLLMLACSTGKAFPGGVLAGLKSAESRFEFLTIKMKPVYVTSYQTGGSAGELVPTDSFSLSFDQIDFQYTPQSPTGGAGTPVLSSLIVKAKR